MVSPFNLFAAAASALVVVAIVIQQIVLAITPAKLLPQLKLVLLDVSARIALVILPLLVLTGGSPAVSAQANATTNDSRPAYSSASASTNHSQPIHAKASWYGPGFNGHKTSTGEKLNPHKLTAAVTNLPLGSTAKVKNLDNGRSVKVRINDCGPGIRGRDIDLSSRAAQQLHMKHQGVVPVEVKLDKQPADVTPCPPLSISRG